MKHLTPISEQPALAQQSALELKAEFIVTTANQAVQFTYNKWGNGTV